MEAYPVGTFVNHPKHEGAECIEPALDHDDFERALATGYQPWSGSTRGMTVLPLNGGTAGAAKAAEALATTPVKSAAKWSAKCGAIETRHATPQAPASAGEESQKTKNPRPPLGVTAGSIDS